MLTSILIAAGALGAVVSPLVLARANPRQKIPSKTNRGIVIFYAAYALSVALVIVGALLSSRNTLWGIFLIFPFLLARYVHNAKIDRGD
jgi:hypothetical protein